MHLPCILRAFDDNGMQLPIKKTVTIMQTFHLARIRSHIGVQSPIKVFAFYHHFLLFFFILGNGFQRFVGQTFITSIFSKYNYVCIYVCMYVYMYVCMCEFMFVCMCVCTYSNY